MEHDGIEQDGVESGNAEGEGGGDPGRDEVSYSAPAAAAVPGYGMPVVLAIYVDRAYLRAVMRDDAEAAGLTVGHAGPLADLLDGGERPHADIVLVDCPQADAAALAALSELDTRAARRDLRLIVSTSVDALDEVFACMDQSAPVLLVDPSRAERVIALGQALAGLSRAKLRDLSESDLLMLLRLAEQIGQIAGQLGRLPSDGTLKDADAAFRFAPADDGSLGGSLGDGLVAVRRHPARPRLPDPRLVRKIIRQRQARGRYFDAGLFADPAWDMLLDLTASRVEMKRISVSSLCIASGVPPTTALRWIGQMVEAGLFTRVCDDSDRRRAFIELTDKAVDAMAGYFAEIA